MAPAPVTTVKVSLEGSGSLSFPATVARFSSVPAAPTRTMIVIVADPPTEIVPSAQVTVDVPLQEP